MSKFFILFFTAVISSTYAQSKIGEQAVFKECLNTNNPVSCTTQKIHQDILKLFTPDIINNLKTAGHERHISVCFIIISDQNGNILQDQTEIYCDEPLLKDGIQSYIKQLPVFHPKDKKQKERRSLYLFNEVFLYNSNSNTYLYASQEELKLKNIKGFDLKVNTQPNWKGCDEEDNTAAICFLKKFSAFLTRKVQLPKGIIYDDNAEVKLYLSVVVEKDGRVIIYDIKGGEEELREKFIRVMQKLPKVEPATLRGFPVRTSHTIPVILKVSASS